ncbi:hypothetical protein FE392_13400 [Xenorhabdus sp. 12]|uniref:Uncharacterized protein n=1 Tax=Xenorhabdus santafensis TaxID=2582833 RepID=A0ABU4SC07_9GAMM|nr:hypothetical protein [Xenorhabdus sp. 12]MDX7988317.1 hypothetical protein [Xenorhabdus sp. 12]
MSNPADDIPGKSEFYRKRLPSRQSPFSLRKELLMLEIPNEDISDYELVPPGKTEPYINFSPRKKATFGFHVVNSYVNSDLILGLYKRGFIKSEPYNGKQFFMFDNSYPNNNYLGNLGLLGKEIKVTPFAYETVMEPFMGRFNAPSPEINVTIASILLRLFFHRIDMTASSEKLREIWYAARIPFPFEEWLTAFHKYEINFSKF